MPTIETAIHKTGFGDLYAALGDRRNIDGVTKWAFRIYYNPLIDLVFFGVLLMGLGGGLAAFGAKAKQATEITGQDQTGSGESASEITDQETSDTLPPIVVLD